jgi:hypothetical protein
MTELDFISQIFKYSPNGKFLNCSIVHFGNQVIFCVLVHNECKTLLEIKLQSGFFIAISYNLSATCGSLWTLNSSITLV